MESSPHVSESSRVLVLGGAGFIGKRICSALAERAVVCDILPPVLSSHSISVQGDIQDVPRLVEVMKRFEITDVIHLVGLPHIPTCQKSPHRSFGLNLGSVSSALEAMRLSDVKRITFASTAAVYGRPRSNPVNETSPTNPLSTYGYHKLLAEKLLECYVQNYGLSSLVFRIFNVYGGDFKFHDDAISTFISNALDGKPLNVNGGNQARDFIRIDDVSAAFLQAIDLDYTGFEILNLGSGVPMSILAVAEIVRRALAAKVVNDPKILSNHYDIFADNTKLRSKLNLNPLDPVIGIPDFARAVSETVLVA